VPGEVAGPIQPRAGISREGIRDEALRGELGPVEVATRHLDAADAQLRGRAHGHRPVVGAEQVDRSVGDGTADGHDGLAAGVAAPRGDVDRRLGGPVEVAQLDLRRGNDLRRQLEDGLADGIRAGFAHWMELTDEPLERHLVVQRIDDVAANST